MAKRCDDAPYLYVRGCVPPRRPPRSVRADRLQRVEDAPVVATSSNVMAEAERLVQAALDSGLQVKMMGGVAIWLTSPSVRMPPYARAYRDLDLVAPGKEARALRTFLEEPGYVPERMFNAIHGAQRLNFGDPRRWTIDVCSTNSGCRTGSTCGTGSPGLRSRWRRRTAAHQAPDVGDQRQGPGRHTCLLADRPPSTAPGWRRRGWRRPAIDVGASRCPGTDWGICHTLERNLRQDRGLGRERPRGWRSTRGPGGGAPPGDRGRPQDRGVARPGADRRARALVRDSRGGSPLDGGTPRPVERLAPVVDRRPRSSSTASSSCSKGGITSSTSAVSSTPPSPSASSTPSARCGPTRSFRGERPVVVAVGVRLLELHDRCGGPAASQATGRGPRRSSPGRTCGRRRGRGGSGHGSASPSVRRSRTSPSSTARGRPPGSRPEVVEAGLRAAAAGEVERGRSQPRPPIGAGAPDRASRRR